MTSDPVVRQFVGSMDVTTSSDSYPSGDDGEGLNAAIAGHLLMHGRLAFQECNFVT